MPVTIVESILSAAAGIVAEVPRPQSWVDASGAVHQRISGDIHTLRDLLRQPLPKE